MYRIQALFGQRCYLWFVGIEFDVDGFIGIYQVFTVFTVDN